MERAATAEQSTRRLIPPENRARSPMETHTRTGAPKDPRFFICRGKFGNELSHGSSGKQA
jgi:hypothetical protein